MTIPSRPLVLSLFTGVGSLDHGFKQEGFCPVSAGDVAYSNLFDVRDFHPPEGVFEGIIGGDPCQSHSALANLVRAKGLTPSFPDMTGELARVISEALPVWFLRENTPKAPDMDLGDAYHVHSFVLENHKLDRGDGTGFEQMRKRRFWFGVRADAFSHYFNIEAVLAAQGAFATTLLDPPALAVNCGHDHLDGNERIRERRRLRQAVTADNRAVPVKIGGSGKLKQSVTGRHDGAIGVTGGHAGNPPRYTLDEMLELQGLPLDVFKHSKLTMEGKRKMVGNAVPVGMARHLARAIFEVMGYER